MEIEKFLETASELLLETKGLLKTKNEDYSKGDAFGAFDKQAQIARVLDLDVKKREHDALYRIVGKLVRLRSLEGKSPQHESVRDNVMDGINFFILYHGMRTEEKERRNE